MISFPKVELLTEGRSVRAFEDGKEIPFVEKVVFDDLQPASRNVVHITLMREVEFHRKADE